MNKNEIEYKGYVGTVEWSDTDGVFYGKVLGIDGLWLYEGNTINELKADFRSLIDEYFEDCKKKGITPTKPFKGSFNIRVGSDLHRLAFLKAEEEHVSLNKLVINALNMYLK